MPRDLLAERHKLQPVQKPQSGWNERAHVASGGFIEGIPVVGPYIREGADRVGAGILSMMYDQPYQDTLNRVQGRSQELREEMPITDTVSGVAGSIAGTIPAVMAAPAAFGAGGGPLLARSLASGVTGGAIGGLDAGVRNDWDTGSMAWGAGLGAGIGAAAPIASDLIGAGWQRLRDGRAVRSSAKAVLEGLNGFMCFYEEAIARVAKEARPATKRDAQWRSWLLLATEVSCTEDLARFAVMAAEAVRDEADADFDERHARKAAGQGNGKKRLLP